MRYNGLFMATAAIGALLSSATLVQAWNEEPLGEINIIDPHLKAWVAITPENPPGEPVPGTDYGMDAATGTFKHPTATPLNDDAPAFPGQLEGWDQNTYVKNVNEIAFYPHVTSPWHAWVDVADIDGKRYLYAHDRDYMRVLDITDPAKAVEVYSKGGVWNKDGSSEEFDSAAVTDYFGGITIAWSAALQKNIVVASYEIGRQGLMRDKRREPEKVEAQRHYNSLKGFKVFTMDGPTPDQWTLVATRTTDIAHPDAPIGQQQGSGSLDAPNYHGGKYMILSSAPDDSYALTEFPDYLYSPGYQVWDMSNPANPVFVKQVTVPGQVVGDAASEAAYLENPRAGNRTSWMGSRMPMFTPAPVDKGGKIGFGAMAGLGLYTFDLAGPADPKVLGHLTTPPSYAGTEFDNVDTSQFVRTGYVLSNGYPMNSNCYEPYKDVLVIDAKDPTNLTVAATLPRPTPPADAGFTDYCQRGGSFGPKRSGQASQPGGGHDGVVPYAFYTAGLQIFDVTDPTKPTIGAYFVPRFPTTEEMPDWTFNNSNFAIFTEYDRNIIWLFSANGVYALSTPMLGEPVMGPSPLIWPPRD